MAYGKVSNSSGTFVKADLNSVTQAAAAVAKTMPDDFRVSITNPPGRDAYPIASFTWLLIPSTINDTAKKSAITDFLRWMLQDAQKMTEQLSYAPLPPEVVAKEAKMITQIN
jgi:phosphate transport system substrate-binding protein